MKAKVENIFIRPIQLDIPSSPILMSPRPLFGYKFSLGEKEGKFDLVPYSD